MKWDKLPQRFFSDEVLDALYRRYEVDCSIQDALRQRLENSAREWFYNWNIEDVDASPSEVLHSLNKISKHAKALKEVLETTPDAVWTALVRSNELVKRNRYDQGNHYDSPHYPEVGLIGTPAITVATDNETDPFVAVSISDLIFAIDELASTTRNATKVLPKVKTGPSPDKPLANWIADMSSIWHRPLRRPFTFEEYKGEPISDAACFCVEIYRHLSPETPQTRVMNEMKKRISEDKALLIKFPHWKK